MLKKKNILLIAKSPLILFSLIYLVVIKIRLFLFRVGIFRSHKINMPVISVGNITWGGTGKTPLIELICRYLIRLGKRPAVLTRGYGSDEDKLLKEKMPDVGVFSGKNRILNIPFLYNGRFNVCLLDDGFQHMRIRRDLDIVTINAADPFGNGFLIPAGSMREPVSAIRRADIVVITKSDLVGETELFNIRKRVQDIRPDIAVFEARHEPVEVISAIDGVRHDIDYLKNKKICAVSALGDNSSFVEMVRRSKAHIALSYLYRDHHSYTKKDIKDIQAACKDSNIDAVITTEKDWIKLRRYINSKDIGFLVLKISFSMKNEENFFKRISSLLSG